MVVGDVIPILRVGLSILLWSVLALFIAANVFWIVEVLWIIKNYREPSIGYGPEDVQVRILTIDAEAVVQETVDRLPDYLADRHVIAETPMDIKGATVHVVPESFECSATRKGRALEWARRELECDKEFLLFLDEDTEVPAFDGLPDADIVQFREEPQPTGSLISYLAEMYRMGFQLEQLSFGWFEYPLYTWGGGLAVRKSLEDQVTWDTDTVIEDTKFVWRATLETDAEFSVVRARFKNQSPPSIRSMVRQRRRWIAGSREEHRILPLEYVLLYGIRDMAWALSPIVPFLFSLPFIVSDIVVYQAVFQWAALALFSMVVLWCLIGIRYFGAPRPESLVLLVLSPVIVIPHAAGALYGMVSPPRTFEVTRKVTPTQQPQTVPAAYPTFPSPGTAIVLGPKSSLDTNVVLDHLAETTTNRANTLLISFSSTIQDSVNRWDDQRGADHPPILQFVPVGGAARSIEPTTLPSWLRLMDTVEDPTDPVYLAFLIEHFLSKVSSGEEGIVWIDSLTALLETVDLYTVLGLLAVISDTAKQSNGTVYLQLDPTAHDDQTIRLVTSACDGTLHWSRREEPVTPTGRPTEAKQMR